MSTKNSNVFLFWQKWRASLLSMNQLAQNWIIVNWEMIVDGSCIASLVERKKVKKIPDLLTPHCENFSRLILLWNYTRLKCAKCGMYQLVEKCPSLISGYNIKNTQITQYLKYELLTSLINTFANRKNLVIFKTGTC